MKYRYYKKSLVLGIIIIFVGASFISSSSINSEKVRLSSNNKSNLTFLSNDDYLNAYWKP